MAVFDELNLDHQEYQHLRTYFANNLSLKATVEALFLHKNTIQYQSNRIWKRTGYNPRTFQDAVVLHIGCAVYFGTKLIPKKDDMHVAAYSDCPRIIFEE